MLMVSSCKQVIRWWSESLDCRISAWRQWMIRVHTLRCPPCARYQEQVLMTREMHRLALVELTQSTAPTHRLTTDEKRQIAAAMETAGQ